MLQPSDSTTNFDKRDSMAHDRVRVVTKRRNELQPSTATSKSSTTTYKHLKNIYNHPQTIEYQLKQAINA